MTNEEYMGVKKHIKAETAYLEHPAFNIKSADSYFSENQHSVVALCELLDIDADAVATLTTSEKRIAHLQYKLVQKEFALIGKQQLGALNKQECEQKLKLINLAYAALSTSSLFNESNNNYSAASVGLSEWYIRGIEPEIYDFHSELDEDADSRPRRQSTLQKRKSLNFLDLKDDGIEPGYKGFQDEHVCLFVHNSFQNATERQAFIQKYMGDTLNVYTDFEKDIARVIVKLTHKQIDEDFIVTPERSGIERTKTISDIPKEHPLLGKFAVPLIVPVVQFKKRKSFIKKNIEAILEVLANDVARVSGLGSDVQEQVLLPGLYKNGALTLTLKAIWVDGARTFKPLYGVTDHQYRAEQVILARNDIKYLSENPVPHLAQYLPLLLIQGDNDAVGSQGQNKLIVNGRFVGIDFGHAYAQNILNRIQSNFTIQKGDPAFKNYSIFHDSPRSDIIRGLLILAKLKGEPISNEVIASYGPEFVAKMESIAPHGDEKVFDDYVKFFANLKTEFSGSDLASRKNRECCDAIIREVGAVKTRAAAARDTFVNKFKDYISLPKNAVDLLDSLEKVMAGQENTSLRSQDKTVLLNHLRIKRLMIQAWKTSCVNGIFTFRAEFNLFSDAASAEAELNKFLGANANLLITKLNGKSLEISFNSNQLELLNKALSENRIKEKFHKQDTALYNQYLLEKDAISLLKSFADFNIAAELLPSQDNNNAYCVQFKSIEGEIDPIFKKLLEEHFVIEQKGDVYELHFPSDELQFHLKRLGGIPVEVNRKKKLLQQEQSFNNLHQWIQQNLNFSPSNSSSCLSQIDDLNYRLVIPADWDPILINLLQEKMGVPLEKEGEFIFRRDQLEDFISHLKDASPECFKLRRIINETIDNFETKKQNILYAISSKLQFDLVEEKGKFVLTIPFDKIGFTLQSILIESGFHEHNLYTVNDLASLLERMNNVTARFKQIQDEISDDVRDFHIYANAVKEQFNLTVKLQDDKGDYCLLVEPEEHDSKFDEILFSKLPFVDPVSRQVPHKYIGELNMALLPAASEFGEYLEKQKRIRELEQQRIAAEKEEKIKTTMAEFVKLEEQISNDPVLCGELDAKLERKDTDHFTLTVKNRSDSSPLLARIAPILNDMRVESENYVLNHLQLLDLNDQLQQGLADVFQLRQSLEQCLRQLITNPAADKPSSGGLFSSLGRIAADAVNLATDTLNSYQADLTNSRFKKEMALLLVPNKNMFSYGNIRSIYQLLAVRRAHIEGLVESGRKSPECYTDQIKSINEALVYCEKLSNCEATIVDQDNSYGFYNL